MVFDSASWSPRSSPLLIWPRPWTLLIRFLAFLYSRVLLF